MTKSLLAALLLVPLCACQSAYYATMEKFGVHKRDILVDRVEEARDAQTEAKEEFQDALVTFKKVQAFDGGELEELYDELSGRYDDCKGRVETVQSRIESIEKVSKALFAEWREELDQIQDASLRAGSEQQLRETEARYEVLIASMKRAESKMQPVLTAFNDRVLYLKHNLNARAIAALQGSLVAVENDVAGLIREMEASIAEADAFVKEMDGGQ